MQLSIKTNFPDVQAALAGMQRDIANKATPRALNGTMAQARTAMSREIRAEFNLPASKVREALRIRRASFAAGALRLQASLEAPTTRGRSLNVIQFAARQTRQGVTVRIRKQGGRQLIRSAFIGNKGRTVFVREPGTTMASRNRYAGTRHAEQIKPVRTIDVPQMFNARRINARVVQMIIDTFPRLFQRELAFYRARAAAATT